jgi:ferritin-like protein
MNDTTLSAIDSLIDSFEKNTYTEKHVISLLNYLITINEQEDKQTISAIIKVLSFCTKDFVKQHIVDTIQQIDAKSPIKASLLSVCWESGLDYSNYVDVFVNALIHGNEATAIEAYTMILEFTTGNEKVKQAIEDIHKTNQANYSPAHRILINDSLQHLISLLNN